MMRNAQAAADDVFAVIGAAIFLLIAGATLAVWIILG
jgi:hypothetical protein